MTLAADSAQEISNGRPGLKNKVEGRFDQLKQPGVNSDLEAKKQVDQAWNEIDKVLRRDISAESIDKINLRLKTRSRRAEIRRPDVEGWYGTLQAVFTQVTIGIGIAREERDRAKRNATETF